MAGQQWPPGPSLEGLFFGGRGLSYHHGFGVLFFLIDLGNMTDDGNGDRGRERFPFSSLPDFSREVTGSVSSRRRRARVTRLVSESNAVINCFNEMYHPSNNF